MTMLDSRRNLAALSNRELEVLAEVARARSNAAIAADGVTNRRVSAALAYQPRVHVVSDTT